MTQNSTLNVKLSYSQLFKLNSGGENGTEVTLNLSSNVVGNSNDETLESNLIKKFKKECQQVQVQE